MRISDTENNSSRFPLRKGVEEREILVVGASDNRRQNLKGMAEAFADQLKR